MKATYTLSNAIGPAITRMIRAQSAEGRRKVMQVIGMAMRNWAMEAFTDPTMRPAVWPAKADGSASTLQGKLKGTLRGSLRVEATESEAVIGSDRVYARIHQTGGVIKASAGGALRFQIGGKWVMVKQVTMPARPYLPVNASGDVMPAALEDAADAAIGEMTP